MEEKQNSDGPGGEPAPEVISDAQSEDGLEDGQEDENATPSHPIPAMQGPFEESIADASKQDAKIPEQKSKLDAKARHQILLDTTEPNETYNAQWRAIPNSGFHPLSKIIAQIAFGVHLLQQELAKSHQEVVKILQTHVDEVDNFLQRTTEDLEFALADIKERINYLKLPLEHVNIFDIMLEDKQFRTSIIEGNEKIERVVNRTAGLMNDIEMDISKGLESTTQMAKYLSQIDQDWPDGAGSIEIYLTMQANADGWEECLGALRMKANSLGVALGQLEGILNEMAKRAGVASRRSLVRRFSSNFGRSLSVARSLTFSFRPRVDPSLETSGHAFRALRPCQSTPGNP
jgi:hypothetical protein